MKFSDLTPTGYWVVVIAASGFTWLVLALIDWSMSR